MSCAAAFCTQREVLKRKMALARSLYESKSCLNLQRHALRIHKGFKWTSIRLREKEGHYEASNASLQDGRGGQLLTRMPLVGEGNVVPRAFPQERNNILHVRSASVQGAQRIQDAVTHPSLVQPLFDVHLFLDFRSMGKMPRAPAGIAVARTLTCNEDFTDGQLL